jgi:peptide/nickel transport system permease protein
MMIKLFSFVVIGLWIIATIVGQYLQLAPNAIELNAILQTPSASFWLGTDDLGRSIAARLLHGFQVSLMVALVVTSVSLFIGVSVGLVAGFYGGKIDRILMQITDIFLAFPGILLAIAFAAVLGPGLINLTIALCVSGWVGYARLTRGQTMALRQRQHVIAALSLGASHRRIILKHILPLLLSVLVVEATFSLASVIIAEASLSFLGLGIQAPNASWGAMLRDAVRYMLVAPHYVLIVGVSLMSIILAINLGGDYLRDTLDVKKAQ